MLKVTGAHAWATVDGPLTSGMVGLPVTIEYDEAWEGLTKNLVCRCSPWNCDSGETRTILNVGETAVVAHEVMQAGKCLHLGVEGFREDGKLVMPTVWAMCGEIQHGANADGDPAADPTLPVWNQLQAQIEQINRDGITQEKMDEIYACADTAAQAARSAERSEGNAALASHLAVSSANSAEEFAIQAQTSEKNARTSATSAANLANGALQAQRAAEDAAGRAEAAAQTAEGAKICTFLDAYVAWCNGEAFPVAFYGDSTFQGVNTSGAGHTFCDHLQAMLREECGANAVIHNAGISGWKLSQALEYFDAKFGDDGTYADSRMVGLGYGINDRLDYTTYSDYKKGVYAKLETLIRKCIDRGIQPFLVTSQATTECGVSDDYAAQYPLRDSNSINLCANGAKKELAEKYGIPLVDLNRATEQYLLHSAVPVNTIISDRLHFGDTGHAFEAGFLFSQIVPRVVQIDGRTEHVLSYASQNLRSAVPENRLSYGGRLKLFASYTRTSAEDVKIFDAYVYVADHPAALRAYRSTADATSYVKIDGMSCGMAAAGISLGTIDVGLHHLEAYSGTGTLVDFAGFTINEAVTESTTSGVLCDTTTHTGEELQFQAMSDAVVPVALMAGFNSTARTALLSGKRIDSIYLNVTAGSLTIGKLDLTKYGSADASLIDGRAYTIPADGYITIHLGGLSIGANETLAIGSAGDTAYPYFLPASAVPGDNALILPFSPFKDGAVPEIGMKIRVVGK